MPSFGFFAVVCVLIAYALTLFWRIDGFKSGAGAESLQATYHVLWTMEALASSPPGSHWYLPTVTLAPEPGNDIRWGATIPTTDGAYVYTSFPPLGFLLPFSILTVVGAPLNVLSLAVLNSILGLVAAIGLGLLARGLAVHTTGDEHRSWLAFIAVSVTYLFLREPLHAHGPVYWAHSPSQVVFILACWLGYRQLTDQARPWEEAPILVLCLLFPLLEWTGYVFNCGLAVVLLLERQRARLPISIVLASVLALAMTLGHYFLAAGIEETLSALGHRATARSFGRDALGLSADVVVGYWRSVGPLLPLGILAVLAAGRLPLAQRRIVLLILGLAGFPLLENLLMAQHAAEFSYARLKVAVPLLLALGVAVARWPATTAAVPAIIAANIMLFIDQRDDYSPWAPAAARNDELVASLNDQPNTDCAIYGTTGKTRGYLNLLFARDIYENQSAATLLEKARTRAACLAILVTIRPVFPDMPAITRIEIFQSDGTVLSISEPAGS
ncbi:MAG: hypothetical protein QNI93_16425 [Kiloniellales bacterium]|nr:hypothetical protein [Kiloniellales bacterium]